MTDHIDEMFARDLEKLSMPSQLALNAQKVKAAQDPKKKGAEKPDLGAPGKGGSKTSDDHEKEAAIPGVDPANIASGLQPGAQTGLLLKGKGKLLAGGAALLAAGGLAAKALGGKKKEASIDDIDATFAAGSAGAAYANRKKKDHDKEAGLSSPARRALTNAGVIAGTTGGIALVGNHFGKEQKKRGEKYDFDTLRAVGSILSPLGVGAYQVGRAIGHSGKKKEASIDDIDATFSADLHQIVGLDVPEARADFERPNVKVADQDTDLIDDHYLAWMKTKSADDVVVLRAKEAGLGDVIKRAIKPAARHTARAERIVPTSTVENVAKQLAETEAKGALKGVTGTAVAGGGAAALYSAGKKKGKSEERKDTTQERRAYHRGRKTAGVNENAENLDLVAKLRRRAAAGLGGTIDA